MIVPFGNPRGDLRFLPFVEPSLSAVEAPVVWLPEVEQAAIPARAKFVDRIDACDFNLPPDSVRAHVHFDGFDRQIVILEGDACRAVLTVDGALVTLGPVRLQIGWLNLSNLAASVFHLNALSHLLMAQRYLGPVQRPGSADARHIRNALIAFDGERAGASRRQMAAVIYGEQAVSNEWSEPSGRLKAMVKRDVVRGRRLVSDGWRELVMAGTFRAPT